MRTVRAEAVLLTLLVLVPVAVAQEASTWDEVAGGPGRSGAAFLPTATLDVLASGELFEEGFLDLVRAKGLVATPHGLKAVTNGCDLLTIDVDTFETTSVPLDQCAGGRLVAYDRARDHLLVCRSVGTSTDPTLQARDARTGEIVWTVVPDTIDAAAHDRNDWECQSAAVVGDSVYTVLSADAGVGSFGTATSAQLGRYNAETGAAIWVRSLGAQDATPAGGVSPRVMGLQPAEIVGVGGFQPGGLTVTPNGLVVSGRVPCTDCPGAILVQGAVAWFDHETGAHRGGVRAEDVRSDPALYYGQYWATAHGALAAFALAGQVLLVNPSETQIIKQADFEPLDRGEGFIGSIPSVWWGDTIAVSIARSVTGVDATDLTTKWRWTYAPDWVVGGLLVAPPSDLFVLVASVADGTTADAPAALVRLDLDTGQPLQEIVLPRTVPIETSIARAHFQPLSDGRLLLYDRDGGFHLLGRADAASTPRLDVSSIYPDANDRVMLSVTGAEDDVTYTIAWGDGTLERGGTSWSHRYGVVGDRTVRVTAAYPDGTTATAETLLRVGATPPPSLTPLQRAFAPENQDLTFGLLGIALTVAGASVALLARRRRHGRLHEGLRALEDIRARGRADPEAAVRALGAFREGLLAEMAAHRLDEGQFNTLDARAGVVFASLRTRLLGPLAGRLTADFRHALDVVLHDGRVDPDELAELRAALTGELHLSPEERERLLALLDRLRGTPTP